MKKIGTLNALLAIFALFVSMLCFASKAQAQEIYTANEKSLARHYAVPDWFRDAKLGIYFTWGPYTVAAKGNEWYPRWMHFKVPPESWQGKKPGYHIELLDWHTQNFGHPSEFAYHDMIPRFTAEHFDAAEWVDLFELAGAKFAGPVAMHHDGYALWDSQITPWNSANIGPKRDITGEITAELRKRGMKLITTFHHARNLQRYKGQSYERALQKYGHLDMYHMYWNSHFPWVDGLATSSNDPELAILYGNMEEEEWIDTFWLGSLKEVVDRYQPDIVWFDTWLDLIPEQARFEFASYYLNAAGRWGKDVMITHKDRDMPYSFSVEDFEQGRRDKLTNLPWLTDDTISKQSWSYIEGLEIKPASWVLHDFIDIVSKNGQLSLNISPKFDGTIPEDQKAVLKELGNWLHINGEAIYKTRPWKIFGEGPTKMSNSGHFTKHVDYTAQDIRFTQNDNTLYAIALGMPHEEILISSLSLNNSLEHDAVTSVKSLNGNYIEYWKQDMDGLRIKLKANSPSQLAYAFSIQWEKRNDDLVSFTNSGGN
ncbi:alpha-L-fucosidase [Alteromonas macleodii]|uniref:alpha-L-fucosidase n=1 Tax=Alteromonas macleodii TaxID=28108 RepID=A0A6T9Y1S3_ALTMA|nr:alpha-L-fucosidase [Alteromonas macleodii]CAB9493662.1 Alpha-L-fucosidase, family GH29 [Alteromonas macleodii]